MIHMLHRRTRDPESFDRRLFPPMVLGSLLNPVNSSMIAVALVPIGIAFGAPPAATAWLVSGLYLATAIGQPVVGRLVDTFGPRRLFLAGSALVGLAGLLGALAPSLGVLVAARVLLGFGTCAGYPAAMYLIRRESERTGRDSPATVLTILSISTQTVTVVGPTVGGLLIGLGGWRAVFLVNVPLALASLVLGALRLPRPGPPSPGPSGARARIDHWGILLFAATVVALLLFLMQPSVAGLYLLGIAAVAGVAFAVRELRAGEPFIDLRLLGGNVPLVATYLRSFLSAVVSYSFLYAFTQWLEEGRQLSATAAGLVLLPLFLVGIVVSALTGRRPEIHGKLLVGAVAMLVGCALLLLLGATSPIWLIVLVVGVVGIPQGLLNLGNQNALYHQAEPERIGASAGLLRTFFYLGAIVAAAANGALLGARADTVGLHELAVFLVVVSVVSLAMTVFDRSLRRVSRQGSVSR